jgi:hypothetical protein
VLHFHTCLPLTPANFSYWKLRYIRHQNILHTSFLFLLGAGYCSPAMKITDWDNSPKLGRNTYHMLLNTVILKAFHTAVQELQSCKQDMLLNGFRWTTSVQLCCLHLLLNSQLFTHIQYSHTTLFGTQDPLQLGTLEKVWNLNSYHVSHWHTRSI